MAVSGWLMIFLALGVLLLPLQWIFAMVLAAGFHELCHWIAIILCGGKVPKLRIGMHGVRMEAVGLSAGQELICAMAGPLGGLFLLLFARWLPRTAICGAFQSLFNLLPVYPLDGGRVLRCLGLSEKFCDGVEKFCFVGMGFLGIYGTFFLRLGILPLSVAGLVILRAKRPCKPVRFSVQ